MTCEYTKYYVNSYDISEIVNYILDLGGEFGIFCLGLVIGFIVSWYIYKKNGVKK